MCDQLPLYLMKSYARLGGTGCLVSSFQRPILRTLRSSILDNDRRLYCFSGTLTGAAMEVHGRFAVT